MPFKIELTGDTIAELIEAVNEISTNMVIPFYNPALEQTKPVEPIAQPAKPKAKKAEPAPALEPAKEPEVKEETNSKPVTKAAIRDVMKPILQTKHDEIVELLKSFNVTALRELDDSKNAEFLEKLEAL